MLKNISKLGWCYFTYSLLACAYFTAAAIGGWKGPDIGGSTTGGFYSGGSSYGRSFGGSWGGGK